MDEWGIKNYAGQIEVVEKSSSLGEVSVRVAGKEALQAVGGTYFTLLEFGLQHMKHLIRICGINP